MPKLHAGASFAVAVNLTEGGIVSGCTLSRHGRYGGPELTPSLHTLPLQPEDIEAMSKALAVLKRVLVAAGALPVNEPSELEGNNKPPQPKKYGL